MGRTAYQFWFESSPILESCGDRWTARDAKLGLTANGGTEDEARRALIRATDQLLAALAAQGPETLRHYFDQHDITYSLVPSAITIHPELDEDEDLMPLEDLRARRGVA